MALSGDVYIAIYLFSHVIGSSGVDEWLGSVTLLILLLKKIN